MSSDLQNRLLQYEVHPPERVWEEIKTALDQDISESVASRLYQFEQSPPTGVWEKIAESIEPLKKQAKLVPFYKKYRKPLKYAGAVAAMTFLAVLVSLLITKKTESEIPIQGQTNKPGVVPKTGNDTAVETEPENKSFTALIAREPAKRQEVTTTLSSSATGPLTSMSISERVDRLFPKQAHRTRPLPNSELSDRYMVYSDDEGHAVRLPKKMYDAIACPTDDMTCKQRIKNLQQQIASSALTADFTGVLEMLNNMKDKK